MYGMVWYGTVWYGMVWYGTVRYGTVWYVWYGMVWYGMVCVVCRVYGMAWYGVAWYGMVWHGMEWHGVVRRSVAWYLVVTVFTLCISDAFLALSSSSTAFLTAFRVVHMFSFLHEETVAAEMSYGKTKRQRVFRQNSAEIGNPSVLVLTEKTTTMEHLNVPKIPTQMHPSVANSPLKKWRG